MKSYIAVVMSSVVVVGLAMGVTAPAAFSAAGFHSEVEQTKLQGGQVSEDVFTFNVGTIKCKKVTYSGLQGPKTAEIAGFAALYDECTVFGFVEAEVHTANCGNGSVPVSFSAGKYSFSGPCPMFVTFFSCVVEIAGQTISNVVTYTNKGFASARKWIARVSASGFTYVQKALAFPGCSNGTFTNGKYIGEVEVIGKNSSGTQVGIWYE